ncbi:hypothetical protein BJP36_00265 [Moorena producens JHB]|uniref:Uncharacterized protein n=1 Tax=Moorena producens (strain JHB) TaxID=1454205 RepID=A0A1D9FT56_MOOP1|nr:hypothetical protein [Moorena producens]AOY78547.1 hypothetical protein BJP36_00265 [Moorena producens JHB]
MARLTLVIPCLASVQKAIVNSFHKGGGVSYSAYPDFMNLWAEINADRFDATITQKVLPLMPDVVEKMRQSAISYQLMRYRWCYLRCYQLMRYRWCYLRC